MAFRDGYETVPAVGTPPVLRSALLLVTLMMFFCGSARANVCVYKTLYVKHVQGHVRNQLGEALPSAKVIVKRGTETVAETTADQEGNFRVEVPRGEYELHIEAPGYAPDHAHIKVGLGFRSALHSPQIYIALSPGVICFNLESGTGQSSQRSKG